MLYSTTTVLSRNCIWSSLKEALTRSHSSCAPIFFVWCNLCRFSLCTTFFIFGAAAAFGAVCCWALYFLIFFWVLYFFFFKFTVSRMLFMLFFCCCCFFCWWLLLTRTCRQTWAVLFFTLTKKNEVHTLELSEADANRRKKKSTHCSSMSPICAVLCLLTVRRGEL